MSPFIAVSVGQTELQEGLDATFMNISSLLVDGTEELNQWNVQLALLVLVQWGCGLKLEKTIFTFSIAD